MVPTTLPEDIAAYAQRVADSWKIGRREVGDGAADRGRQERPRGCASRSRRHSKARCPTRRPAASSTSRSRPAFRAGDFAGGLNAAVDRLDRSASRGEGLPAPAARAARPRTAPAGFDCRTWRSSCSSACRSLGGILKGMFGRKLGSLRDRRRRRRHRLVADRERCWSPAASALVALLLVGVMGIGRRPAASRLRRRRPDHLGRRAVAASAAAAAASAAAADSARAAAAISAAAAPRGRW